MVDASFPATIASPTFGEQALGITVLMEVIMARPFRFSAVLRMAATGREWADKARRLEDSGFDTLLVPDHLVGPRFAPIAALTAAACATTRLNVGTLVFANDFRHPAILAKEATTIDIL